MAEYFRNNESIKAAGVKIEFTPEQVQEMTKCALDPVYFTENYVQVEHVDHGIIPYEPRAYQKKMFNTIHDNRYALIMVGRQSGKCATKNTKYKVRNKKTGETLYVTAEEFHAIVKGHRP